MTTIYGMGGNFALAIECEFFMIRIKNVFSTAAFFKKSKKAMSFSFGSKRL
jgi:hypothetical protein